jgi:2-C-methyl-D-erythritol 4-phosphate cytidylyltransferase
MSRKKNSPMRIVSVILGAGQGTRMGQPTNKIFLPINGKPIIVYSIEVFERCTAVDEILLVAAAGEEEQLAKLTRLAQCRKVRWIVQGGATRHASEQCALQALRPHIQRGDVEIVLIHDGARPFVSSEKVEQLIQAAREVGGAILATPLEEEERVVKVNSENRIIRGFERQQVWKAQTPQAFQAPLLLKAYDLAERDQFSGTDTAVSVERIGGRVAIIESDATNLKITTAHDLLRAERLSYHWYR